MERSLARSRHFAAALLLPLAVGCSTRHRASSSSTEEGSTRPGKHDARVIELDLGSGAPEASSGGLFPAPATRTYTGLVRALEKGLAADTTAGVLVKLGEGPLDLAQVQELGELLGRYSKKGLPVVCHANGLSNAGAGFVQRACTKRFLGPAGEAATVGMAAQIVYLKSLLDRLKIEVDFLHVGKFKSGPEPLLQDGPSPEAREALDFALGSIRDSWLSLAATPEARAAFELGPFSPPEAKAHGLVDELGYESDALAAARKLAKTTATEAVYGPRAGGHKGLDIGEIIRVITGGDDEASGPHVAVVPMQGAITTSAGGPFASGGITSDAMVKVLAKLAKNEQVKAVVIRIDSPGGSPLASDLIWHELMNLRKKKPVIASVGGMAASGGFYIASGAQKIYAEPASIVGSIGVFGGKLVVNETIKEYGLTSVTFPASHAPGAAERAGYLSPLTPWNDETRGRVRALMQGIYDLFIARVAEGRKMDKEKVLVNAEGRIWSGPQGLERGLIDQIGGLDDAIVEARKLGKVPADSAVSVEGGSEGLLDMLSLGDDDADAAHVAEAVARFEARKAILLDLIPLELRPFAASLAPLFMGESVVAALPYAITVR
jgi:protease-4